MIVRKVSYEQTMIRKITRKIPLPDSPKGWFLRIVAAILAIGILVASILVGRFYLNCKQVVDRHLSSQTWSLPSTIYADAPMIYEGMPMKQEKLLDYLGRLNYQKTEQPSVQTGQYSVSKEGVTFSKHSLFFNSTKPGLIRVKFHGASVEQIMDLSNREDLPAFELEPMPISNLFGQEWEKRTLIHYRDIPPHLIHAVLAIEDRRFFSHGGVDLKAILRAVMNDLLQRKQLQGGSTLTQQLVKNFYLTPERSIRRKTSEAMMAWIMERRLSKTQILELYLNEIYLGQRGPLSINGVGEASRVFFHKDVENITVPEAALIAGMIQLPNAYNPYRHPKEAKTRRDIVLRSMLETGALTKPAYEQFVAAPIVVQPFDTRINLAPYFGEVVKTQLLEKYDSKSIYTKNLHIFTTLDLDLQQAGEEALAAGLNDIDKLRYKKVKKHVEGSLIAIEPQTGFIRAYVGGRSYSNSQFDRVTRASRQPGSVFKPVVYAMAIEESFMSPDRVFTPASLIADEPWSLRYANKVWEPKNYDGQYHGIVTLRNALANSMNVATAKLAQEVGLDRIALLGKRLGFGDVKPYPSLALGAFEVSPWQAATAYTVFANGGVRTELRTVKKVVDTDGKTLERSQIDVKNVLHPQTAFIITDMLRTVLKQGTGAAVQKWGFTRPAAGKTGTTDEYRDAWFVGYTPSLLCVVWTGYDDNTPIKMTGAQAALPIWVRFMKKATENTPPEDFSSPQGIVMRVIDPTTGDLATDDCPISSPELFIEGTEPVRTCTQHKSHWWNIFG
jgi:penicillin-binding protein 1B